MESKKIAKKIKANEKYKIDQPLSEYILKGVNEWRVKAGMKPLTGEEICRPSMLQELRHGKPYTTVTYTHGGKTDVVNFPLRNGVSGLDWFIAGMAVSGMIFCLAYLAWRIL